MASKEQNETKQSNLFDSACAKISGAEELIIEGRELLKRDIENLRREKEALEEMTKTLNRVHFGSTIKLNVGGKMHQTTLDTLRKDPDSMLCAMFSGRFELKPDEQDGSYFIDRDGKLFRHILNYLRNGEFHCPNDRVIQEDLLSEARFYQVQGMVDQLERALIPLKSSVILRSKEHLLVVMSWLPPDSTCSLLYRATNDGGNPKDFHRCCDKKGANLVVIKSGEYICGGYTSKSWDTPPSYTVVVDSECFLFTLVNPSKTEPMKFDPKPGAHGVGIRCGVDLGPRFCEKSMNALELNQKDAPPRFVGRLNLVYGFTCPPKINKDTFFTGKSQFDITELEIFKVDI